MNFVILAPLVDSCDEEEADDECLFAPEPYTLEHSDAEESHSSLGSDWDPSVSYNLSYSDTDYETDRDIREAIVESKIDIEDLNSQNFDQVGFITEFFKKLYIHLVSY
jgi:hypothetical protein